ncbi:hypothetical protein BH23CHL9_BH23CHL9_13570 [soil metagenome]
MNFDDTPLTLLRETDEVDIETMSSDGRVHRTTIWVVADTRDAYVRSVRGDRGRWYRELRDHGSGALMLDGERVPVRAVAATDPASIELVSDLLRAKYGQRSAASTASMLTRETLPTTLRLEPA